jgi:hypothetical protein
MRSIARAATRGCSWRSTAERRYDLGYTTEFTGQFNIQPTLKPEHREYITAFGDSRRMKRDPNKAQMFPDPLRHAAELPVGIEGEYFVGVRDSKSTWGDPGKESILDSNEPPSTQPGLWCQWRPNAQGDVLEWDGSEKFYNYEDWLLYLIANFFAPWGYRLDGEVEWQGEDRDDRGILIVTDNAISTKTPTITWN